ncbi:MAG: PAS domain S-box protein [Acidobacteria bacterium]|nr:MAG: PAS domain S-box protein [Acidobacteriota bacterium]
MPEPHESYKSFFDDAPLACFSIGVDGRILLANRRAHELLGYPPGELIGRPVIELYADTDAGKRRARQLFERFRNGRRIDGEELEMRARDGRSVWVSLASSPIRDRRGDVARSRSILVDVTARKRAEDDLRRARQRLEEQVAERTRELAASNEKLRQVERLASLGTLAAGIAHEINNPIGAILLLAANALESAGELGLDERCRQTLEKIIANCQRCHEIIRAVRQFAGLEPSTRELTDVNAVIRSAIDWTRGYARQHGAELRCELAPDLPPLLISPAEIEQVFVNLLRNAVEAGSSRIRVRSERTGGGVRAVVEDDGRGMSDEVASRLFDPFFTTRRHGGGSGLGMSISHGIVSAHDGTLRVASTPGRGTTITLELPGATRPEPT